MTDTETTADVDVLDIDAILAGASLPEVEVPLCLNGKLRREYEETKARIDERAAERDAATTVREAQRSGLLPEGDTRLGVKGTADQPTPPQAGERDPEQDDLDRLRAEMLRFVVRFRVRAMPSQEWNRLFEKHPPRKDPATGKTDQRDWEGVNSATFYPALVQASIVSPPLEGDRWDRISAVLTDAQFDRLAKAAAEVNRRDEDIPF